VDTFAVDHPLGLATDRHIDIVGWLGKTEVHIGMGGNVLPQVCFGRREEPQIAFGIGLLVGHRAADQVTVLVDRGEHRKTDRGNF